MSLFQAQGLNAPLGLVVGASRLEFGEDLIEAKGPANRAKTWGYRFRSNSSWSDGAFSPRPQWPRSLIEKGQAPALMNTELVDC